MATGETEPGEDRRLARLASVARDAVRHFRGVTGLLFSNSRAAAELVADLTNEVLREEKLPETFLVHHGSLSREIREDAEESLSRGIRSRRLLEHARDGDRHRRREAIGQLARLPRSPR